MNSSQTQCDNGEICFAEFLQFRSHRPVSEITEILECQLRLSQFDFGENDRLLWGTTLNEGVEYFVSRYVDSESWHESAASRAEGQTFLTMLVRKSSPLHGDRLWSHDVLVPAAARVIADAFGVAVVHQKTHWHAHGKEQVWNRTLHQGGHATDIILDAVPEVLTAPVGWGSELHQVTADRGEIRNAAVVICVTNAIGSILAADEFGLNAVILDDAQPENVPASVLIERPDLTVIKCLANVPGLHCPFDFGLFEPNAICREVTFTCLAETIVLAATGHRGSFIVGDPTEEQFDFLRKHAPEFAIRNAPFFSFPEVGAVALPGEN